VALYVLETQPVDELWFVPAFLHAFDKPLAPFEDRLAMCERAAAPLGPRVRVSAVERDLGGKSRTLLTVGRLQSLEPATRFSLVVGADLLNEIDSWFGSAELRQLVSFIVVGRQGVTPDVTKGLKPSTPAEEEAPLAMPAVSSTHIRAALGAGESVTGLVPRTVLEYIYERGLFEARLPPR
jgi:nicotinate-nucleotide adenylyltransferase